MIINAMRRSFSSQSLIPCSLVCGTPRLRGCTVRARHRWKISQHDRGATAAPNSIYPQKISRLSVFFFFEKHLDYQLRAAMQTQPSIPSNHTHVRTASSVGLVFFFFVHASVRKSCVPRIHGHGPASMVYEWARNFTCLPS